MTERQKLLQDLERLSASMEADRLSEVARAIEGRPEWLAAVQRLAERESVHHWSSVQIGAEIERGRAS